jgi:CRISPR/Cas system CSM-associated protein Csm3 (group 7 of RAMP superfamily)
MSTRLTLFTATLVQDSALSVSGLDRDSGRDQPFAIVDGVPTLVGRGLKGAAVAMARRFFDPLPRAVSDDPSKGALRRSAWEFADATSAGESRVRAGVGIRQKTGARANHVLYDREVVPAGTRWRLTLRVDWSQIPEDLRADEGAEAEGILGYVLARHWADGRCWLGGGAARGLGWCHIEALKAWRLDDEAYEAWVTSGRTRLPAPLTKVPVVEPTRPWCFRTLDVSVSFGEYRPEADDAAWGLDMLAVGPHDTERAVQPTGDGAWARPAWTTNAAVPHALGTDRAILMDGGRPLLPGASLRGPIRHAFSRAERLAGREVTDPHLVQGDVGADDPAGGAFGTVSQSSRILIRDARAEKDWAAAKLHMHAEDEFSAGSYGSAKRDAVRLLRGEFPARVVVEGASPEEVNPLMQIIDRQVALGAVGHLPLGGHKTRGAGWGRWKPKAWVNDDVNAERSWTPPVERRVAQTGTARGQTSAFLSRPEGAEAWVRVKSGALGTTLALGGAARAAKEALGAHALVAWWCDPTTDLDLSTPPATFGRTWPADDGSLQVDEVAFYAEGAVWRAARTSSGVRFVLVEEVASPEKGATRASVVYTPARLHGFQRFSSASTGRGAVLLREWRDGDEMIGFTIAEVR